MKIKLIEFTLNVVNNDVDIVITKEDDSKEIIKKSALVGNEFIFKFLQWCEDWLDYNGLYDIEYFVNIRVH